MTDDRFGRLGDLEGTVLATLWDRGTLTTPEVHAVVGQSRGLAYTTILTVLQRLTRKGLVLRVEHGKGHLYSPALSREDFNRKRAETLAAELVPLGSVGMAAFLAEAERLDPTALQELRQRIEQGQ